MKDIILTRPTQSITITSDEAERIYTQMRTRHNILETAAVIREYLKTFVNETLSDEWVNWLIPDQYALNGRYRTAIEAIAAKLDACHFHLNFTMTNLKFEEKYLRENGLIEMFNDKVNRHIIDTYDAFINNNDKADKALLQMLYFHTPHKNLQSYEQFEKLSGLLCENAEATQQLNNWLSQIQLKEKLRYCDKHLPKPDQESYLPHASYVFYLKKFSALSSHVYDLLCRLINETVASFDTKCLVTSIISDITTTPKAISQCFDHEYDIIDAVNKNIIGKKQITSKTILDADTYNIIKSTNNLIYNMCCDYADDCICMPWQDKHENICYSTEDRCANCPLNIAGKDILTHGE